MSASGERRAEGGEKTPVALVGEVATCPGCAEREVLRRCKACGGVKCAVCCIDCERAAPGREQDRVVVIEHRDTYRQGRKDSGRNARDTGSTR